MIPRLRHCLLAGLALVLLGLAGVPLFWPILPEPDDATADASTSDHTSARIATAATPDALDQWTGKILARPLFHADRKPDAAAATEGNGSSSSLPRLAGIAFSPFGSIAIFQPDGGKPILVGEGGVLAGWTVKRITAHQVTLAGVGGERNLTPRLPPYRPLPRPS